MVEQAKQALSAAAESDGLNDAPWWARFTVRVGVPAALAFGLVLFIMSLFSGDVATTKKNTEDMQQTLRAHIQRAESDDLTNSAARAQQTLLLQVICLNMAQMSGGDQNRCLSMQR